MRAANGNNVCIFLIQPCGWSLSLLKPRGPLAWSQSLPSPTDCSGDHHYYPVSWSRKIRALPTCLQLQGAGLLLSVYSPPVKVCASRPDAPGCLRDHCHYPHFSFFYGSGFPLHATGAKKVGLCPSSGTTNSVRKGWAVPATQCRQSLSHRGYSCKQRNVCCLDCLVLGSHMTRYERMESRLNS